MNIKLNYLGNITMSDKPYLPYMKFGPISTQNLNTPSDYCLEQKKNKVKRSFWFICQCGY